MIFCTGDLISIPSDVKLIKESNEDDIVEDYKFTNKPELGIFIKYTQTGKCLINTNGDKWSIDPYGLRIYEGKYDKAYSNIQATK